MHDTVEMTASDTAKLSASAEVLPRSLFEQIIRFGIVGVINTAVDLLTLNLLIAWAPSGASGWRYSIFKAIAFSIAVCNSYLMNRRFTFQSRKPMTSEEASQFVVISLVGLLINVGVATAFVSLIPPPSALADYWPTIAAISGIPAGLLWNFLGYRYIVFDAPNPPEIVHIDNS